MSTTSEAAPPRCAGFRRVENSQFCADCGMVQQVHNTWSDLLPGPVPAVGQRWADGDRRANVMLPQREVVIVEISHYASGPKARCRVYVRGEDSGREVGIALRRLKPPAYRFVGVDLPANGDA